MESESTRTMGTIYGLLFSGGDHLILQDDNKPLQLELKPIITNCLNEGRSGSAKI